MTNQQLILFLCLLLAGTGISFSQETEETFVDNPPVFIELLPGHRAFGYQMTIDKKLQSIPKLGFFAVTNLQAEWDTSKIEDYMVQGHLTYEILNGVNLEAGFIMTIDGIRPSTGIIFSHAVKDWFLVFNPRMDIHSKPNLDLQTIAIYTPKINETFDFYGYYEGMYIENVGYGEHTVSYLMLRAGLTYKDISFGVGSNINWYGPDKHNEFNVGPFLVMNLF